MKRAIALCLTMSLLIIGCRSTTADESSKEQSSPPVTSKMPDNQQEPTPQIEVLPSEPTGDITETNTLVILVPHATKTLDPYLMTTINPEDSIAAHLWDTLVWIDDSLTLVPRVAESWQLINDTTWEFKLRQGITFQNGEPLDATAVRFSIERSAQLENGVETFVSDVGLQRIDIVDDHTVHLITSEPNASVPYQIANVEILPPIYYGSNEGDPASLPIGSGPYRFAGQESDGSIILEANQNYWQGPPAFSTLIFRPVTNPQSRVSYLLNGEAQLVSGLSPDHITNRTTDETRAEMIESTRRLFVGIRVDPSTPMGDRRVRQALNYAVDVDALVARFAGGYGQRYASWVNPPHNSETLTPWPYDPEKARELLTEAGYSDGFQTTLDTPIGRYHQDKAIAYAIAEQLEEIGIQVDVQPVEWSDYVENRLIPKQTSSLFLLGIASRGNGLEDTANLVTDFPFNPTLWRNAEFEEIITEASYTFNNRQRQNLLNQAQAIAYEEAPWIWLWRPYDFYGMVSWLDWKPRPDGLIYLYQATTTE